uniref:Uncharacterized protein n=1 Tax=Timema shepardi TaxID=629360 RepID=A0A7R9G2S9_TIMSH|nr:unnamed protein product [Timema shepardi]
MGPLAPYTLNHLSCGPHFTFHIDTKVTTTISNLVGNDHHNINTGNCDLNIIIIPITFFFNLTNVNMSKGRYVCSQNIVKLSHLYEHPDDVDYVVGGSLEAHVNGALSGPSFLCVMVEQFYRTRAGDKFFYENGDHHHSFTHGEQQMLTYYITVCQHECLFPEQLNEIRKSSISRLLCDNGDDIFSMQPKGFQKISHDCGTYVAGLSNGEYVAQSQLMLRHCHQQTARHVVTDMKMPVANIYSSEVVDVEQSPCDRHTSLNMSEPSGGCLTSRTTSLATPYRNHVATTPHAHHLSGCPAEMARHYCRNLQLVNIFIFYSNSVVHCKRDDLLPVVNLGLWKDHNQHK